MKKTGLLLSLLTVVTLVACGGGGGGGGGGLAAGMNITVATGAPVAGASVTVVDANGNSETCPSTTNSSGVLNCALSTAKTAPYFIKATNGSNSLFAVMPETGSNLNITPISDVMAKKFAAENNSTPERLIAQPALMAATDKTKAADAVTLVNAIVSAIAANSGLSAASVANPLTRSYLATSTDQMDKFIQNIQINTDSTGINFSIPTSTGTVAINIAYTASTTSASSTVTGKSAQLATASLTDGDKIDTLMGVMLGNLPTCGASASGRTAMAALFSAKDYGNGLKYMHGGTVAEWIAGVCNLGMPAMSKTFSKTLARFGNKIIFVMGVKPTSGSGPGFEMSWAAIKTGDATFQASDPYGGWRIMADNMPPNFSLKTRHALTYEIDASTSNGLTKMKYERYIDTWAGRTDGTAPEADIPAKVKFYAVPLKTMAENYVTSTAAATYFASLTPTFTLYKTTSPCNSWYSLDATKTAGDCEFFAKDNRSAAFTGLFSSMENNEFTLLIVKNEDSNGNCLNCETINNISVPMSFKVLGKAYTISQLFGSAASQLNLVNGVSVTEFATAMTNARAFYGAPSTSDLAAMEAKLRGNNPGSTFTVNWQRSYDKRPLDGVWGGWNNCGGGAWTTLNEPDDTTLLPTDSWTYNPPTGKTSFNQAGYLSFAFGNKINLSEFTLYLTAQRGGQICTN